MRPASLQHNRGFTLIELSIVLTVIGLMVGGILAGQELIQGAEIRATISQFDKFNTAANTFRIKFGCLPGDCPNAVALGLGKAGGPGDNGNGDGMIGSGPSDSCYNTVAFEEMSNFWYHLVQAQFLNDPIQPPPANPCNSKAGIQSPPLKFPAAGADGSPGGWWVLHPNVQIQQGASPDEVHLPSGRHIFWITSKVDADDNSAASVLPSLAYAIDNKIDDGLPFSGTVHATTDYALDSYGPTETILLSSGPRGGPTCIANNVTPNQYNMSASSAGSACGTGGTSCYLCGLALSASF